MWVDTVYGVPVWIDADSIDLETAECVVLFIRSALAAADDREANKK